MGSCLFAILRSFFCLLLSFSRSINNEVIEVDKVERLQICNHNQIVCSDVLRIFKLQINGLEVKDHKGSFILQTGGTITEPNVYDDDEEGDDTSMNEYLSYSSGSDSPIQDVNMNKYSCTYISNSPIEDMNEETSLPSICCSNSLIEDMNVESNSPAVCSSSSSIRETIMDEYFPYFSSSVLPIVESEAISGVPARKEYEPFYREYSERMRWFDTLNYERTLGISAILTKGMGTPTLFERKKPTDISAPYFSWSKMARKKLLRSLESDFEMVYVAQSCLSWEALHRQYKTVEALACSTNGVFHHNVAAKFQNFQILLERFMEDERCEGKRFWSYVKGRFSLNSLLQVPELSGYTEDEEGMRAEGTKVREVLKAIEKCIDAFWAFVDTDINKKSRWKIQSLLWTYPPVDDPRDLELLAHLTETLQKKQLWLKNLQGKRKCWLRRVTNPLEESQTKEILFTMIDMKLVSRVLKMNMISSPQLKWCQEKLHSIEFKEGKVMRGGTSPFFPSS